MEDISIFAEEDSATSADPQASKVQEDSDAATAAAPVSHSRNPSDLSFLNDLPSIAEAATSSLSSTEAEIVATSAQEVLSIKHRPAPAMVPSAPVLMQPQTQRLSSDPSDNSFTFI